MTPRSSNATAAETARIAPASLASDRPYQELWWSLARRPWTSLVLVPADRQGSTAECAGALAAVGSRLSTAGVNSTVVSALEYGSARALEDLLCSLQADRQDTRGGAAAAQLIISVPSVIESPLGIGIARQADVTVVSILLGATLAVEVRETVGLIGRERIAGCLITR